eukprot:3619_1
MLAPFVPTPAICVNVALKLLQIENSKIFYDLGGGDGRFSFTALRSSQSIVRCVESDARLCEIIRKDFKKYSRMHGLSKDDVSRFELLEQNILDTDFSDATHIYTYLTQEGIDDIEPTLTERLSKGTRFVSMEYPVPNWNAIGTENVWGMDLYLYEI